jgi:hypothetical protein
MPLLRSANTPSPQKRLFDTVGIIVLCCLGLSLGAWEAYRCAKIRFGYVATYSFVGAIVLAIVLIAVGLVLVVYWRTRRIGIGFISAGMLSCAAFYGGIFLLEKIDRVAWRHEPRVAIGADQVASLVIYFCPKTTDEQIENFRESVLERDAEPRHAGRDFPAFVGSYLRLAPSQTQRHDGVALTIRESSTLQTVKDYMTTIESDPRVARVFTDVAPTAIRIGNSHSIDSKCR